MGKNKTIVRGKEIKEVTTPYMETDHIYFNPKKVKHKEELSFEIENLKELTAIF